MKFACTIGRLANGEWTLTHASPDLGTVMVTADSRAAGLEKMRNELRYRLELCPCTGEMYQHVEIELIEQPVR